MLGRTERTLKRNTIDVLVEWLGPKRCKYTQGTGKVQLLGRRASTWPAPTTKPPRGPAATLLAQRTQQRTPAAANRVAHRTSRWSDGSLPRAGGRRGAPARDRNESDRGVTLVESAKSAAYLRPGTSSTTTSGGSRSHRTAPVGRTPHLPPGLGRRRQRLARSPRVRVTGPGPSPPTDRPVTRPHDARANAAGQTVTGNPSDR